MLIFKAIMNILAWTAATMKHQYVKFVKYAIWEMQLIVIFVVAICTSNNK